MKKRKKARAPKARRVKKKNPAPRRKRRTAASMSAAPMVRRVHRRRNPSAKRRHTKWGSVKSHRRRTNPDYEKALMAAAVGLGAGVLAMAIPFAIHKETSMMVRRGVGVAVAAAGALYMKKDPVLGGAIAAGGLMGGVGFELANKAIQFLPKPKMSGFRGVGSVVANDMGTVVGNDMGGVVTVNGLVTDSGPTILGMGTVLADNMGAIDLANWDRASSW